MSACGVSGPNHQPSERSGLSIRSAVTAVCSVREPRWTVVAIPGGPGLSSRTLPLGELSQSARILLVDPPGTGIAPRPEFERQWDEMEVHQRVVRSIAEAVTETTSPDERLILLGHSFGGILAIDCCRLISSRTVAGLVLMASPFTARLFNDVLKRQVVANGSNDLKEARDAYRACPNDANYRAFACAYGSLLHAPGSPARETILGMIKSDAVCGIATRRYSWDRRLRKDFPQPEMLAAGRTFAIMGSSDQLVPYGEVEQECRRLGVEIRRIDNAGHFPHVEAPAEFTEQMRAIMRSL
jgi:pimeloyl-ACP methyl ester carboxylesterase